MACGDVVLFHGRLLHKGSRCVGRRRRASVPVVATPRRVPPGCFRVWCYVDLEFRVTRGRSPADQTAFRHVLASHYIPRSYGFWPPLWVRPPPPPLSPPFSVRPPPLFVPPPPSLVLPLPLKRQRRDDRNHFS